MTTIDLIPESARLAQARRTHIKGWLLSLLGAVVLLAIPVVIACFQNADRQRLREQNDRLQLRLAAARRNLRVLATKATDTLTHLERAKALRSKRSWSSILAVIDHRMTEGCWLTSIASDPPRPTGGETLASSGSRARGRKRKKPGEIQSPDTTVAIVAPRKLRITGFATHAGEPHLFVSNLKAAGVFSDVVLQHSRREPAFDGSYFRFELLCEW